MASPVGHALLGLAVGRAGSRRRPHRTPPATRAPGSSQKSWPSWWLPAAAALVGVAPDLDFLPGLLLGDPNRYHQLQSHTFAAALLVGIGSGLLARPTKYGSVRTACVVAVAYGSHLLLDFFTFDPREPVGIPLLWPLVDQHFASPWPLFRGIRHGVPGQGPHEVLGQIFSVHNLAAVGIEIAVTLPVLLAVHLVGRWVSVERPSA